MESGGKLLGKKANIIYILISVIIVGNLLTTVACAKETDFLKTDDKLSLNSSIQHIKLQIENIDKENATEISEKLSSDLLQLGDMNVSTALKSEITYRKSTSMSSTLTDDSVYVYIWINPGFSTSYIDSYVIKVTERDEKYHLAVAWVKIDALETLASLEGVRSIQTVTPPVTNIGSITTEGDFIHECSNLRNSNGLTGQGIKIGIISDGVDNLATAVNSGDLPSNVHVIRDSQGGDEGTAMLEIVHDIAPGAELYFHDSGVNMLEFNKAVDSLVNQGCTVICDDVGWADEPYFEDGIVASHLKEVLASKDIIYVSSAGNDAASHYQGNFYNDINNENWHDFSSGRSNSKDLYVYVPPYASVDIWLNWNDPWASSSNDYNLYLVDNDLWESSGKIEYLGWSTNTQTGKQYPFEHITYTNLGSKPVNAALWVHKYSGVPKTLELYAWVEKGAEVKQENIVSGDSIFGHPALPDVICVGAIRASSTTKDIEYFSSRGPVTIVSPAYEVRQKPDICGIDGVSITGAGGFPKPFYGTSASAPHIAALVALVWSGYPEKTGREIKEMLYSTATDLGNPGYDNVFGYGLASADKMYKSGISQSTVNTDTAGVYDNKGTWALWNPNTNSAKIVGFGWTNTQPVAGDWDGDKVTEVGIYNSAGNNFFIQKDSGPEVIGLGWAGVSPVVGDWNGDGSDSVGVYDNAGTWALWNPGKKLADIVGFGWAGTKPIVGDWDGDGVTEVGIYNTAGNNFLLKTNAGFEVIGLGWAGVTPVVGDWNGDGKDEVGVYDNKGTWALWNTGTKSAGIVGFGWAGTQPFVGDWDQDGITEVGIYNTAGNNFLLQKDSGFNVIGLGWAGVSPYAGRWG